MIHIDVFMAMTGKYYEFACDPDTSVGLLCRQMTESVLEMEHVQMGEDRAYWEGGLRMYSLDLKRELPVGKSLSDHGIRGGSRMIVLLHGV